MENLNAEQIIKALECCFVNTNCNGCPLDRKTDDCLHLVGVSAMACIKELTEESQKWQGAYDCADTACRELSSKCDELTEENERLSAENKLLESQYETMYDSVEATLRAEIADCGTSCKWCENKVKADTVRKMQERLTERLNRNSIFKGITMSAGETVYDVIDQIAKEMLEGV